MATQNQAGVRLQADEEILLQSRRTAWTRIPAKAFSLGIYIPWWNVAWFVVTDQRLIAKKGILSKKDVSLPMNYVQDASVHRTWYGSASVRISTAGGSGSLSRMRGLRPEDARQLADTAMPVVRQHHESATAAMLAATATATSPMPLARLAQLHDSGGLNDDEFESQKARLLEHA
jgi:hypothetical protein